ncbi:MAG: sigma-54 dependent transcriptional regulator [Candidatus Zixiibacteriota bacterium]
MIGRLVLLTPDDRSSDLLGQVLKAKRIVFDRCTSASEFIATLENASPSIALIDSEGCASELLPLLRTILRQYPSLVTYLYNNPVADTRSASLELSVSGLFDQGVTPAQIIAEIENQLGLLGQLRDQGIFGHSAALIRAAETIVQLAQADVIVLIGGESGTGKEMFARAIHNLSRRAKKRFVPVNCGAIAEGVLESELFGHEKGAFTGAAGRREGYFESADGGTIFLDEIGEIKPDVQVRLLRVLEQRSFMRVGGTEQVSFDVRVIAASNRDLRDLTDEGSFREDLFYRLSVVTLNAVPLRERPVDIMPLIQRFLEIRGRGDVSVDPEAVELLLRYSWPGNIRELRNFVESSLVTLADSNISKFSVSEYISRQTRSNRQLPVVTGHTRQTADFQLIYQALLNLAQEVSGLKDLIVSNSDRGRGRIAPEFHADMEIQSDGASSTLQQMERQMIADALEKVGGNRRKAAEMLGIGQRTLYRKIKEYDL